MEIEILIAIAAVAFSIYGVVFVVSRDKNIIKRLTILESVIDDLHRQSHDLNKNISERKLEADIKKIVEDNVENRVAPLTHSLQEVKKIATEYRVQKEILTSAKSTNTIDYEHSVLKLYKDGKNESEIASVLGLAISQVELILTLNNPE
ncbi:MAG: hypothetical protein LBS73_00145 [Campylobacteraceae bacterium]|jgi:hypothetical protein|nr:hypothetical protein [Campylobacteraceae bacterium]